MTTPFKNCLRKDDVVLHTKSNRRAVVANSPREKTRAVLVRFDGTKSARPIDVMDLRFVPPGETTPEDVPPIEGNPDEPEGGRPEAVRLPRAPADGRPLFEEFNREWKQPKDEPGMREQQIRHILRSATDAEIAQELRQRSSTMTWVNELTLREGVARLLAPRSTP